jgi:hypothetical protein
MSQLKLTADSGGGTVAIKGPASTTGNAAIELTVPGTASGTLAVGDTGKILQVKQSVLTTQFTTTSYTMVDVTGLSVNITPASTSNKIFVQVKLLVGGTANNYPAFKLLRDSTHIGVPTGSAVDGGGARNTTFGPASGNDSYKLEFMGVDFLDSPNTTSAVTYKIQASTYDSRLLSINKPTSVSTGTNSYTANGISTITVMEVAA